MENEILIALLIRKVEERFAPLPASSPLRGPRGQRGAPGRDGKDFNFKEHEPTIRSWVKEFALKFEDLSEEEIEKLRGPRGRDGQDGKDFSFEENKDRIYDIVKEEIHKISSELKLKFSDLTLEEISSLRGPRGRDGRDGKDGKGFDFEEHRAFFEALKPKFSDFTAQEVERLRLHFSDLTTQEKDSLKLRFSDLTAEDRLSLRGPRGARGQRGVQGEKGADGKNGRDGRNGRPGLPGPMGRAGLNGRDGIDGMDGRDAPFVVDILVEQFRSEIRFTFIFSDGTTITTNAVQLPMQNNYYNSASAAVSGGGGNGGGGGSSTTAAQEHITLTPIDISNGYVDLAHVIEENTLISSYNGIAQYESIDYILSTVGGVTRFTPIGALVSQIETGDVLHFNYRF